MAQVIIPNPVINSPFDEPQRHFYFDEDGITDKKVESRRLSQLLRSGASAEEEGRATGPR